METSWKRTLVLVTLLIAGIGPTRAAVITLDATERGFITQSGATNPTNSNIPVAQRDYLLGNCTFLSCSGTGGGEYRDFFGFTIPLISGNVVSVELQLSTAGVDLSQSPSLTATFTSLLSTTSFAALGTGTVYGSSIYAAADANTLRSVSLGQSAIASILADQGGLFLIGDRTTSATLFDPAAPNQLVYEHSGPQNVTRLVITTTDVPEPDTMALLGVAMAALVGGRSLRARPRPGPGARV